MTFTLLLLDNICVFTMTWTPIITRACSALFSETSFLVSHTSCILTLFYIIIVTCIVFVLFFVFLALQKFSYKGKVSLLYTLVEELFFSFNELGLSNGSWKIIENLLFNYYSLTDRQTYKNSPFNSKLLAFIFVKLKISNVLSYIMTFFFMY